MATVKIKLDKRKSSQTKEGKFPLVLRIEHQSMTRDIPFNIHLKPNQYNKDTGVIKGITNAVRHSKRTQKKYRDIDLWLDENYELIKLWSIKNLKLELERKFFNKQSTLSVLNHGAKYLGRLILEDRHSTASSYQDALKYLIKYRMKLARKSDKVIIKSLYQRDTKGELQVKDEYQEFDLPIKALDSGFAKDLRAYLTNRFDSKNTVNIVLRSLQAILNDAADTIDELKDHRPFAKIKKSSFENAPVALTMEEINLIRGLTFVKDAPLFHVRNYFLFMFNNMGMNFYDLALIKVFQFEDDRVKYFRKKTLYEGDYFSIKQNDESLAIIEHYIKGKEKQDYLFPLIPNGTPTNRIHRVKNDKIVWFNRYLKTIAKMVGIEKNVSSYTVRDTWTNIGLDLGIDIRQISSGLGHSSVKVTEKHYGKVIQEKILDEINARITALK